MRRSNTHEIPVGSTADIAFLLLVFFLMATTIETDTGIIRKLPPYEKNAPDIIRKERNIMIVLVNKNDQLMVQGKLMDIKALRAKAKEFISNEFNSDHLPELHSETVDYFGEVQLTSKHIISLCSDRGTSYEMYIAVQNELAAAYNELRNELALSRFGVKFAELEKKGEKQKMEAIESIYPMRISEAEPQKMEE